MREKLQPATAALLAAWVASPPIVIFGLSAAGILSIYAPRYFLWREPGIAIAEALVLSTLRSRTLRSSALLVLCLLMLAVTGAVLTERGNKLNARFGAMRNEGSGS